MLDYEKYLNDFKSTINIGEFALNLLIVALIGYLLKLFYIRYGRAISDRSKFSNNFIPLGLGTMLIIAIIKSSIALSLGLVGALSIVRFRAAIKDPEELTMLFLVIGLGLLGGANKPVLALVAFALIFPLLYLNYRLSKNPARISNKAFLNINTTFVDANALTDAIAPHTSYLEVKRIDRTPSGLNASFFCTIKEPSDLQRIFDTIRSKDENANISFVEQPDFLL